MKCFTFTSPSQKQKTVLRKKIETLNEKIDDLIIKGKTDDPQYQNLIKLHANLFNEYGLH